MEQLVNDLVWKEIDALHVNPLRLPQGNTLNAIDALRSLPRAGKSIRIDFYCLNVPKRSVFDHIISLAHYADAILPVTRNDLNKEEIAMYFLFHDLHEILIGDIPAFTRKNLAQDAFKTKEEKEEIACRANSLLSSLLPVSIHKRFDTAMLHVTDRTSELARFVRMIDQIDPILAIWRYIHLFRNCLDIHSFLEAMNDFFVNPTVGSYCNDIRIASLIRILQNQDNARAFFTSSTIVDEIAAETQLTTETVNALIAHNYMHCVPC